MAEMITTGVWVVGEAKQAAFAEAWAAFAAWASSTEGAGPLRLGRDGGDRTRFVSFGPWDSAAQVRAWKSGPEFRDRIAEVLQHADEFHPSELDVIATATDGTSTVPVALTDH